MLPTSRVIDELGFHDLNDEIYEAVDARLGELAAEAERKHYEMLSRGEG